MAAIGTLSEQLDRIEKLLDAGNGTGQGQFPVWGDCQRRTHSAAMSLHPLSAETLSAPAVGSHASLPLPGILGDETEWVGDESSAGAMTPASSSSSSSPSPPPLLESAYDCSGPEVSPSAHAASLHRPLPSRARPTGQAYEQPEARCFVETVLSAHPVFSPWVVHYLLGHCAVDPGGCWGPWEQGAGPEALHPGVAVLANLIFAVGAVALEARSLPGRSPPLADLQATSHQIEG